MLSDKCSETTRKLSAYIDGELSPEARAAVSGHLSSCPACAAELLRFSAVDAGIKLLPAAEPPPFFSARVSAAARDLKTATLSLRRFLRLPVPAMALMVAFILANLFTFAYNINAMENGPRRELARKVAAQLARPASLINPVALARLCSECNMYMCNCLHEAGRQGICPCKDCKMDTMRDPAAPGKAMTMESTEAHDVH